MDTSRASNPRLLIVATISATVRGFLAPFADAFRARGWRVDGMAAGMTGDARAAQSFDRLWDAPWSRNPLHPQNLFLAARQVRRVVEEGRYDIVHVHTPVAAFITRYALRRLRRQSQGPAIAYTAHGFHFHSNGSPALNLIYRSLEGAAAHWTDFLVVINREDEAAARKYRFMDDARIIYMPGIGVDSAALNPDAVPQSKVEGLRQELGLTRGEPLFTMLANFDPGKRHPDVIRALAAVSNSRTHLALAGMGKPPQELLRLVAELGLGDRVHFVGFRNDTPTLIRAAAAIILTSNREGLSRSVLEAMALAVPVIGTNARGVAELLENGCGLKVEIGDVRGLAQAMDWVLAHEEDARAMGMRGRACIGRYDVRQIIRLHEDLYDRVLKQRPGRTHSTEKARAGAADAAPARTP